MGPVVATVPDDRRAGPGRSGAGLPRPPCPSARPGRPPRPRPTAGRARRRCGQVRPARASCGRMPLSNTTAITSDARRSGTGNRAASAPTRTQFAAHTACDGTQAAQAMPRAAPAWWAAAWTTPPPPARRQIGRLNKGYPRASCARPEPSKVPPTQGVEPWTAVEAGVYMGGLGSFEHPQNAQASTPLTLPKGRPQRS